MLKGVLVCPLCKIDYTGEKTINWGYGQGYKMAETAQENTLYKDFMAVPDNMVAEILNGRLVIQPRPAPKHTRTSSVLGGVLGDRFDYGETGPGGWVILDEPELHLGSDILVPDLAGWRQENMSTLPETAFF